MMSRCAPLGSIGAFARSSAVFISARTSARSLRARTSARSLREGSILEGVVRRLGRRPDVLLVAAAGRDHPRRAGLALHLGAVLDLPTGA
jgi:endonuclease V